jgi:pilus assembly protein CpaE
LRRSAKKSRQRLTVVSSIFALCNLLNLHVDLADVLLRMDANTTMSDSKILVGIISPSAEMREQLHRQLQTTKFSCDVLEINQYCADKGCVRQLAGVRPNIIFIDMEVQEIALSTLRHLHEALPDTCFYVSAAKKDPKLIIETMRAGAREYLVRPVDFSRISLALERYSAERKRITASRVNGKIYCVTSAKGGAGTTSVAVNLAVATAASGTSKVALLDLGNRVGNVADYMDISPRFNIADAVDTPYPLDSASLESYMSHAQGVSVLLGNNDFGSAHRLGETLPKLFHVLTETYAHTFVDIACSQSQAYLEVAAKYSAAVLIVVTPELPVLRGTDQLIQMFAKIGGSHKLRLIVNRGRKSRLSGAIEIEKDLGYSIFWYLPDDYPAAAKAVNKRQPLVTSNHSSLAESYFELAKILTGLKSPKKRRSLFGFW